jgi:hypothetical protein
MNLDYKEKYLKYKNKYLLTKSQQGGLLQNPADFSNYTILFNFFTFNMIPPDQKWPSNVESLFKFLKYNEKYDTPLFKSKLNYLYQIFTQQIPNHQMPKKSYQDKQGFYKHMLELLFNKPDLTLEVFITNARSL